MKYTSTHFLHSPKKRMLLFSFLLLVISFSSNAQTPQYYFSPTSFSNNVFPMASTTNQVQWLMKPSYFSAPAGLITKVYLRAYSASSNISYSNLTIKTGTTALTNFTNTTFVTGLSTVYTVATHTVGNVAAGDWVPFILQTPFYYDGVSNFIMQFSQTSYVSGFTIRQDNSTTYGNARIWGTVGSSTGSGYGAGLAHFGFDLVTINLQQHPVAQGTCEGGSASFSVYTPDTGISYQWKYNNGSGWANVPATAPYSGTTTNTLSLATVTPSMNNYKYRCQVSSATATIQSDSANLTVYSTPNGAITHSSPLNFCEGSAVTLNIFSATAYSYQWYKDGVAIPGATNTYYFTGLPGSYHVQMSVAGCSGSTAPVNVTINPLPSPLVTRSGDTLTSTVFPTYQWYYNQQPIPGATNQSYVTTIDGPYNVSVKDAIGCLGLSNVFYMTHLDVENINRNVTVSIAPNPSTDKVHIEASAPVNVTVRNLQGQIVLSQEKAQNLSVKNLAVGLYMMVIADEDGNMIKMEKLIKF